MSDFFSRRVLVAALVGAALYGIFNWVAFEIQIPTTQNVSLRPHYGLLTFFGFAFGPVAGFLVGFVGNIVGDQLAYGSAFESWWWSVANGLAGLVAGLFGVWFSWRHLQVGRVALLAASASVVATVIGFSFIWIELWVQPALGADLILSEEYLPVVIGNAIVGAIVTPILVIAWAPLERQLFP